MKPNKEFVIYISCPLRVPLDLLNKFVQTGDVEGATVKYWDRVGYYQHNDTVKTCDAFVLILPDNRWKYNLNMLSTGCLRELNSAIANHRNIFIGYKTVSSYCFFESCIERELIKCVVGTSTTLFTNIASKRQTLKNHTLTIENSYIPYSGLPGKDEVTNYHSIDRRLLIV